MRENVAKVAERQERLDSLEARTGLCWIPGMLVSDSGLISLESLALTSEGFRRRADRVRKASTLLFIYCDGSYLPSLPRICGKYLPSDHDHMFESSLVRWQDMKVCISTKFFNWTS